MTKYLVRRLLESLALVWVVTIVTFALINAAPGGPSILLDPNMSPEDTAQLRAAYGLDRPVAEQYVRWLGQLVRGNLGFSLGVGRPVSELIGSALPATLLLSGSALLLSLLVAIPAGILAAVRRDTWIDQAITTASFIGLSLPTFWYGLMLIIFFSVTLTLLPAGGMYTPGREGSLPDLLAHLLLPVVTLATVNMAQLVRYTRSAMIGVLRQDYVRTARAKGVPAWKVIMRHALRNALTPVVTYLAPVSAGILTGSLVVETIFAIPGLGKFFVDSVSNRDMPLIMGLTVFYSALLIGFNLCVDAIYPILNPRLRKS